MYTSNQEHTTFEAVPADQEDIEKRKGDSFFDQWLGAKGEALRTLSLTTVEADLLAYEAKRKLRRRACKADATRKLSRAIEVVVCNLAREVLRPNESDSRPEGQEGLRFTLRQSRGPERQHFPKLLDNLEEAGVLHQAIGEVRSGRSTFEPTAVFARRTREAGITLAHFRRLPHEELIVLRVRHTWLGEAGMEARKDEVDYEETLHTQMLREELRRINTFLQAADITFLPDECLPEVHPEDRKLVRYFVRFPDRPDEFDKGGRAFGGF